MHRTRIVLSGAAIVAAIAMSGCDPQPDKSTAPPAPVASVAPAASAASAPSTPADDAASAKACTDLQKDIKDNAGKVAKAEKIGPPAGNIAVSAQWAAGSAAVIAHSFGANEAVSAAADKVQKEMMALSDATNKSANAKPSKARLDAAVKDLTTACSAT
jgi:hypothetical protein